jgi:23S rRNA pseudouridine1911/1915/1917 synthase
MVVKNQNQNPSPAIAKQDKLGNQPEFVVSADSVDQRLDKWLAGPNVVGSRSKARTALERGKVFLNGIEASTADAGRLLKEGDKVRIWQDRPGTSKLSPKSSAHRTGLWIVYEDEHFLVINKPAGLLVQPLDDEEDGSPTLLDQVETYLRPRGKRTPLLVHRIDRDTSGLVLFAKDPKTQELLKAQFEKRRPERVYWAVVRGSVRPPSGTWIDWLFSSKKSIKQEVTKPNSPHAKKAISEYKVLEQFADAALLEVRLVTGKRNQIRVQAGTRGYPLVGERQYIYSEVKKLSILELDRQALHALKLVIEHPHTRKRLAFEAPLPEDISSLLKKLRLYNRPQKSKE